jgi:hypothetical protein
VDRSGAFVAAPAGAAALAGTSTDGATVIEGVFTGAGAWLGVAPNVATARAATITHAPDAAIPTRRARPRLPGTPRTEMTAATGTAVAFGGAAPTPAGRASAGASDRWGGGAPGLSAEREPVGVRRTCGAGMERGCLPMAPVADAMSGVGNAARTGPESVAWPESGLSGSRNGAHRRQAASTRFQQSEQQVTPQLGQS